MIKCDSFVLLLRTESLKRQPSALRDYKFYCFDGEPVYCQAISDRDVNETIDFFDMTWKHQPFTGLALPHHPFSNNPIPIPAPVCFDEMKRAVAILAKGCPFLRVDMYEVSGRMFFGELTFYPASGIGVFEPERWNRVLGDRINL